MDDSSTAEMVTSLCQTVAAQTKDVEELRRHVGDLEIQHEDEVWWRLVPWRNLIRPFGVTDVTLVVLQRKAFAKEVASLTEQVASLKSELETTKAKQAEAEKEQEDLLVLLEEISGKRKSDKARMRESGLEVSEDEEEEEDGEEDGQA
jgi:hypothetical protein